MFYMSFLFFIKCGMRYTHTRVFKCAGKKQKNNFQIHKILVRREKISMPPWNPHFGYSKVLSQQVCT
jgi:hypothetical protein